ncbi:MAG: hypothetical protein CMJ49_05265 [Planctomycetaceae bacterium]|nr:hypothetical protein [Planctomycetaceae bacterium]
MTPEIPSPTQVVHAADAVVASVQLERVSEEGEDLLLATVLVDDEPVEDTEVGFYLMTTIGVVELGRDHTLDDGTAAVDYPADVPQGRDETLYFTARLTGDENLTGEGHCVISVLAQLEHEPTPPAPQPDASALALSNIKAELLLRMRRQNDKVDPAGGPKASHIETLFRESLEVSADGFIGRPDLIDLKLFGSFGLSQQSVDTNGNDDHEDGTLHEYDVSAVVARQQIAPITLYSRRTQELLTREFAGSLDSITITHGADVYIKSASVPTRLSFYNTIQEQEDLGGPRDSRRDQKTISWHSEHQPTDTQTLTWDYAFNQIDKHFGSPVGNTFDFQTHEATLSHALDFGLDNQHALFSSINVFRRSGDFALDRLRWDESLNFEHSDALRTFLDFTLDREEGAGNDHTLVRPSGGFQHRTFRSLVTTGRLGGNLLQQADGAGSREVFGQINFDYRKDVPHGAVSADLRFAANRRDNEQTTGVTSFTDEPWIFIDPAPVTLARRHIVASSIVVTNITGLTVFSEGLDYTILAFEDRVEIHRVVAGSIANFTFVLVDYDVTPEPANVTTTLSGAIGVRYDIDEGWLRGLGVYGAYFQQDQDVHTAVPVMLTVDSIRDLKFGADYRIWEVDLNAERQIHDSTIRPFEATRFSGRLSHRLWRDTRLVFDAGYTKLDFTDDGNQTNFATASGEIETQITRRLWGRIALAWRDEQDNLRGDTDGFEQQLELRWRHLQTDLFVLARNAFFNTDHQDNTFQVIEIGLRRRF